MGLIVPASTALSNAPFSVDDVATRVLQSLLQSATSLGSTPPSSSSSPASAAGQQPGVSAAAGSVAGSTSSSTPIQSEFVFRPSIFYKKFLCG